MAQSNPIEYHKRFMKAENETSLITERLIANLADLFIEVGYGDKRAVDHAIQIVKPFGDKFIAEAMSLINVKNKFLNSALDKYVSKKPHIDKSDLNKTGIQETVSKESKIT